MRAKIESDGLQVELVGSPTEVGAVLRDVIRGGTTRALPVSSDASPDADTLDRDQGTEDSTEPGSSEASDRDDQEPVDALQFFQDRSPTNVREATAVAAFYLAVEAPARDRSATITSERLGDVFRQAQWKLPARTRDALAATMRAGYLNRVDTGVYELSNTGHNLVVHTLGKGK